MGQNIGFINDELYADDTIANKRKDLLELPDEDCIINILLSTFFIVQSDKRNFVILEAGLHKEGKLHDN
jgi:hypothetical protein